MPPPPYTRVLPQSAEPIYDLTVVTVCRNVLPALKRTTASVLGQKAVYPNVSIEHVIVDGASTDGTPEWLAEMKAQGKIETYISEPDRGIYDAMNKGINLARGHALLFLNADDTMMFADLAPCVHPIRDGKCEIMGAVTAWYDDKSLSLFIPDVKRLYIEPPAICHQAFFASARLYRELGGYNCTDFRCAADADIVNTMITREGFPTCSSTIVTAMPKGGFSTNSAVHYCDERIKLIYKHLERICLKLQKDKDYQEALAAIVLNNCIILRRLQENCNRDLKPAIRQLQEIAQRFIPLMQGRTQKAAMRYAHETYLAELLERKTSRFIPWRRIRRYRLLCNLPKSNPYKQLVRPFHASVWGFLRAVRHLLLSKVHR